MKTHGWCTEFMRIRSPSRLRPDRRVMGSVEMIAIDLSSRSATNRSTISSMSDDFPDPPVLVIPTTSDQDSAAADATDSRNASVPFGRILRCRDEPGHGALVRHRQVGETDIYLDPSGIAEADQMAGRRRRCRLRVSTAHASAALRRELRRRGRAEPALGRPGRITLIAAPAGVDATALTGGHRILRILSQRGVS